MYRIPIIYNRNKIFVNLNCYGNKFFNLIAFHSKSLKNTLKELPDIGHLGLQEEILEFLKIILLIILSNSIIKC